MLDLLRVSQGMAKLCGPKTLPLVLEFNIVIENGHL